MMKPLTDFNDPQEFVVDEKEFNHDVFVTYCLGDTRQIYKANSPTNFGKVNVMTTMNVLDYKDMWCPFCDTLMCSITEDDDDVTIRYASKVKGYEQLCHKCGKKLCEMFGKGYKTTCHRGLVTARVRRSGIYVKKSITKQILNGEGFIIENPKGKKRRKMVCKAFFTFHGGKVLNHVLVLCHGWLY